MVSSGAGQDPEGRVRYRPVSAGGGKQHSAARAVSYLTAPVGGSRLLFPRRLAGILHRDRRDAVCSSIPRTHARWYFGSGLTLWADPRSLECRLLDRVSDGEKEVLLSERFVDRGDWTEVITPLADVPEHRETAELVRYGAAYTQMPAFRTMLERISKNKAVTRYGRRIDSEEKLHSYFRYFLDLVASIQDQGFRDQRSLAGTKVPIGLDVRGKFASRQHDVGAAIGEDGRLLRFLGGRHRTAIAQALGLPAMPVELRLVHADWLAGEARRTALPPDVALRSWVARTSSPASG